MSIVQEVWLSVPHAKFAATGYKQTGPALPMQGAISQEDLFRDLLRVWEIIDPSTSPTQVGTKMRDDAVAFVQKGHEEGKWTAWADCHQLIEEQDCLADATPEGMEAFGFDAHGNDDDQHEPDEEGSDDEDGGGGGSDLEHGGGPDEPYGSDVCDEYDDGDDGSGDDGYGGLGGGTGGVIVIDDDGVADAPSAAGSGSLSIQNGEAPAHEPSLDVAAAHQTLYQEAMRTGDDVFLRHIRQKIRGHNREQTDTRTNVGALLKRKAQEDAAADTKRYKLAADARGLEAKDIETIKLNQLKENRMTVEACERMMLKKEAERRVAAADKKQAEVERARQRWLQTAYPVELARR